MIARPTNPVDRRIAVMDLYDAHELPIPCTAEEVAQRFGSTTRSVGMALQALGFARSKRRPTKKVDYDPPRKLKSGRISKRKHTILLPHTWARPFEWPARHILQRRLRRAGLSAFQVAAAEKSAEVPGDILENALNIALASGTARNKGVIRQLINELLEEERRDYKRRSMPIKDVAAALDEAPDANPAFLVNRTKGLVRAATRDGQEIDWQQRWTIPTADVARVLREDSSRPPEELLATIERLMKAVGVTQGS